MPSDSSALCFSHTHKKEIMQKNTQWEEEKKKHTQVPGIHSHANACSVCGNPCRCHGLSCSLFVTHTHTQLYNTTQQYSAFVLGLIIREQRGFQRGRTRGPRHFGIALTCLFHSQLVYELAQQVIDIMFPMMERLIFHILQPPANHSCTSVLTS